ncbi:MAG: hypothetical protein LKJ99_01415 [Acidaminococcaceae bacterium]|jgi:hypothetical protein|nr:hypothetical protein [Acidaminococcaceae bacterium]MCI2109615.1 hypothetical protein [Acidaminococcaceae bacterium]
MKITNLHKKLIIGLVVGCLTTAISLPVLAAATKPSPVVPGMDRRIPGQVESAKPGTPWAKTRTYTPPASQEPVIKGPVIKTPANPAERQQGTNTHASK